MPELPEVETVRRGLWPLVQGRRVLDAWFSSEAPQLLAWPSRAEEFTRGLVGQRIEEVGRRGKYLLFPLSGGRTWIVHLRMTGALLYRSHGCQGEAYLRARFLLEDGVFLCYTDLRKLGRMWLVEDPAQVVGKLGPEPLGGDLTTSALAERLRRRRTPIKAALLDQTVVAGLGNIYADEALFEAGLHPCRLASSLSLEEVERLRAAIERVLTAALEHGGSSFRAYVDAEGRPGSFHLHVKVFRRTGQPCYRCGGLVERLKVGGRSTHFCPRCQPWPTPIT